MLTYRSLFGMLCVPLLVACQPAEMSLSELSPPEKRLFAQASEARAQGKTAEAMDLYTQAAKLSSGAVEAHLAIAQMLRADNKAAQSLPMIHDALVFKPQDARLHMEKGFALVASNKFSEAIESFDRSLAMDEEMGSAYSGKAIAYDMQGQHIDAQRIYSEAIARGLTSPAMENNYALSLIFTGKYDEAIAMLKPHADSSYATSTMQQNIALAYGLKGDVGRAKKYGSEGLDPISAKKNMEFYKRFSALKQGKRMPRVAVSSSRRTHTAQAVPAVPVDSQDVGFITESGKSQQVIITPKVDMIEMDAEAFEEMLQ